MSQVGERDDAPEVVEDIEDGEVEQQGANGSGADEDGADALGEEPGEGAESDGDGDDAGENDGQARQQGEVAPRRQSASDVIRSLKAERKEDRRKQEELTRQVEDLLRGRTNVQTQEQQRLENERLSLMAPEERFEHLLNRQAEATRRDVGALQFQMQDSSDRTAFESLCARDPAYAAVRDDVEQSLKEMRGKGGNADRQTVAYYHIGKRAVERAQKGGKKRLETKGQQNIQRQTTKPPASRGDVASSGERRGGSEKSQLRSRLENIDI